MLQLCTLRWQGGVYALTVNGSYGGGHAIQIIGWGSASLPNPCTQRRCSHLCCSADHTRSSDAAGLAAAPISAPEDAIEACCSPDHTRSGGGPILAAPTPCKLALP